MKVNGKDIEIYELDTNESIITRIAATFNTLPKFLILPEFNPQTKKIKVIDILELIRKEQFENLPSTDLPDKELLQIWLSFNKNINDVVKSNSFILNELANTYIEKKYFVSEAEFKSFWNSKRNSVKTEIELGIKNEKRQNESNILLYDEFNKIEEGLVYTQFVTERVIINLELQFDEKNISLLEIFNDITTNDSIPFISCDNYYKILRGYILPEEWVSLTSDEILLKLNNRVSISMDKYKEYIDVSFKIKEVGDSPFTVISTTIKILSDKIYTTTEKILDRIFSIFERKIDYTVKEDEIVGIFYFPTERIDNYVFSDLVMNNKIFSSLINIDESVKATKRKSDNPWIFFHFFHPATGSIKASLLQKTVDRSDINMRNEDMEIFVHGDPYIRVRVVAKSRESIVIFQDILSKLLVLYRNQYNQIVEFYRQYIPLFGNVSVLSVPMKKKMSSLLAPEIFVTNYSRICKDTRMPTIINKEDVDKYKDNQVMVFPRDKPKDDDKGVKYPSDGIKQQYYVCLNPENPYPGLQKNKLTNSDYIPYGPCCFGTDQNKRGSLYRNYFYGETTESKDKRQQELIITDKILGIDKYGNLSPDIQMLFEMLDNNLNYKYIRVGIDRTKSSFIEAVMTGMNEITGISKLSDADREIEVLDVRQKLIPYAMLCKQCMYDSSINEIENNIRNPKIYLEPLKYIQLLEHYFDCTIYVFNKNRMLIPRNSQGYYSYENTKPIVMIYEHMGSESDHSQYPQCEVITLWNVKKSDDIQLSFPFDSKLGLKLKKIFNYLTESYVLTNKLSNTILISQIKENIFSQQIDSYGKTRRIDIKYNKTKMTLLVAPIAPLTVKMTEKTLYKVESKIALDFFTLGTIEYQVKNSNGMITHVSGTCGNIKISVPIIPTDDIENLPIVFKDYDNADDNVDVEKDSTSQLQIYNTNQKLARYISEYSFWLFSRYLKDQKITEITDKVLAGFAKKYIKIDDNFKYGYVNRNFSTNSPLLQDGKLIVTSEEMLRRIMYVLKLYSIRNLKDLLDYYSKTSIAHYYTNILDFEKNPNQIILKGDVNVFNWIQEYKMTYNLMNEISIGRAPYFFKNKLIGNTVFLAQNTDSLENAINISYVWNTLNYNPGIYVDKIKKNSPVFIELYVYKNPEEITVKYVGESSNRVNSPKIKIIGYKIEGKAYYTTLLELK